MGRTGRVLQDMELSSTGQGNENVSLHYVVGGQENPVLESVVSKFLSVLAHAKKRQTQSLM